MRESMLRSSGGRFQYRDRRSRAGTSVMDGSGSIKRGVCCGVWVFCFFGGLEMKSSWVGEVACDIMRERLLGSGINPVSMDEGSE